MKNWNKNLATTCALTAGTVLALSGCASSSSSSTSSSSSVTLTGTASDSASSSRLGEAGRGLVGDDEFDGHLATAITSYKMYCVTMTVPPVAGSGDFGADGSFSLTLTGAAGQTIGCFVVDKTSSKVVATLTFSSDSSGSGLGASQTGVALGAGSTALGAISFNSTTGTGSVTISSSKLSSATIDNPLDITGTWKFSKLSDADFAAYSASNADVGAPCAQGAQNCQGPSVGSGVYVKRFSGKSSKDNSTVYGVSIWPSQAGFAACGSVIGLSKADFDSFTGVTLDDSTLYGPFTWSTSVTLGGVAQTVVDGWKFSGATSSMQMRPGTFVKDNGIDVNKVTNNAGYVMYQGPAGCSDSSGAPVMLDKNGTSNGTGQSCTSSTDSTTNYVTNTCTMTLGGKAVTCKNTFKILSPAGVVSNSYAWDYNNVTSLVAPNALCSSITASDTASTIGQLQCYANYLGQQQGNLNGNASYCVRQIHPNFMATTAADFLGAKDIPRPMSQYIMEKLIYSDNNTMSFMKTENMMMGAQGQNAMTPCNVRKDFGMKLTKISATQLRAEMSNVMSLQDSSKKECAAMFSSQFSVSSTDSAAGRYVSKMITVMNLDKQ